MYFKQCCGLKCGLFERDLELTNQTELTHAMRDLQFWVNDWQGKAITREMHSDLKLKLKIDCWLTDWSNYGGIFILSHPSYGTNYDLSSCFLPIVEQLIFCLVATQNTTHQPEFRRNKNTWLAFISKIIELGLEANTILSNNFVFGFRALFLYFEIFPLKCRTDRLGNIVHDI